MASSVAMGLEMGQENMVWRSTERREVKKGQNRFSF